MRGLILPVRHSLPVPIPEGPASGNSHIETSYSMYGTLCTTTLCLEKSAGSALF